MMETATASKVATRFQDVPADGRSRTIRSGTVERIEDGMQIATDEETRKTLSADEHSSEKEQITVSSVVCKDKDRRNDESSYIDDGENASNNDRGKEHERFKSRADGRDVLEGSSPHAHEDIHNRGKHAAAQKKHRQCATRSATEIDDSISSGTLHSLTVMTHQNKPEAQTGSGKSRSRSASMGRNSDSASLHRQRLSSKASATSEINRDNGGYGDDRRISALVATPKCKLGDSTANSVGASRDGRAFIHDARNNVDGALSRSAYVDDLVFGTACERRHNNTSCSVREENRESDDLSMLSTARFSYDEKGNPQLTIPKQIVDSDAATTYVTEMEAAPAAPVGEGNQKLQSLLGQTLESFPTQNSGENGCSEGVRREIKNEEGIDNNHQELLDSSLFAKLLMDCSFAIPALLSEVDVGRGAKPDALSTAGDSSADLNVSSPELHRIASLEAAATVKKHPKRPGTLMSESASSDTVSNSVRENRRHSGSSPFTEQIDDHTDMMLPSSREDVHISKRRNLGAGSGPKIGHGWRRQHSRTAADAGQTVPSRSPRSDCISAVYTTEGQRRNSTDQGEPGDGEEQQEMVGAAGPRGGSTSNPQVQRPRRPRPALQRALEILGERGDIANLPLSPSLLAELQADRGVDDGSPGSDCPVNRHYGFPLRGPLGYYSVSEAPTTSGDPPRLYPIVRGVSRDNTKKRWAVYWKGYRRYFYDKFFESCVEAYRRAVQFRQQATTAAAAIAAAGVSPNILTSSSLHASPRIVPRSASPMSVTKAPPFGSPKTQPTSGYPAASNTEQQRKPRGGGINGINIRRNGDKESDSNFVSLYREAILFVLDDLKLHVVPQFLSQHAAATVRASAETSPQSAVVEISAASTAHRLLEQILQVHTNLVQNANTTSELQPSLMIVSPCLEELKLPSQQGPQQQLLILQSILAMHIQQLLLLSRYLSKGSTDTLGSPQTTEIEMKHESRTSTTDTPATPEVPTTPIREARKAIEDPKIDSSNDSIPSNSGEPVPS